MTDTPRLIEHAFPLKQASLDSVHEKNVRHGHISTLHIWPARRPLAASRAALIATLLPDPGTPEARKELCERIGGRVVKKLERKKMPNGETVEREKDVTEGGILHWGRETENKDVLDWFREEIRKAYGGRAPKVLDPFAGGGAIPLEAMRLGCDVTAMDINPVAWFILKCTLEYPQKLAGKTHPLPDFILENEEFMETFYKAHPHLVGRTKRTKKQKEAFAQDLFLKDKPESDRVPKADLAWHVRAWGHWVLDRARQELARFYPTYADFEPLDLKNPKPYEKQPMQLAPLKQDGTPDIDALNKDFSKAYLADKKNPRWIAKPTVAYLWARTVTCKNCRATIPLLKTRWLCKKDKKRVLLTMEPNVNKTGVVFGIDTNVPARGGNVAQKREHDKRIGLGTMSKSGAKCQCCGLPSMTMEDIRLESIAGSGDYQLTAVVTEGLKSKEYREPTDLEVTVAKTMVSHVEQALKEVPDASVTSPFAPCSTRSISAQLYGVRRWIDLYTSRQAVAIARLGQALHRAHAVTAQNGYSVDWIDAIMDYLCLGLDRFICFSCVNARWKSDADSLTDAFSRFSISLLWDFAEAQPLGKAAGAYIRCNERIATALDVLINWFRSSGPIAVHVINDSADQFNQVAKSDLIITDPPYYEAVSYADLSDFFYVWLRGFRPELAKEFSEPLTNKTKEAVQHIREDKDRETERRRYEDQMAAAFVRARQGLTDDGRFVCVFAHKDPVAWETLASAIIRAGFVVTGSWPIQTEMPSRQRASSAAALASSVWLVCKPRIVSAKPGWDNQVLDEMRRNIRKQLREFWDAGIRGPDFVWAATGPALEAYSKHLVVKKANEPGPMTVSEFLTHVRRMVVDFVVGRVLAGDKENGESLAEADRLDEPTAYYLLHRHDFGLDEAPAGACILYAISCGISDKELADTWDLIGFTKGKSADEADEESEEADVDEEANSDAEQDSGSKVKLKTWAQRRSRSLGYEAPGGKPVPLIDRVHCLMHLWKAGDLPKVEEYLDTNGLRRQELFRRLLQSLIELSPRGSEERSLLESLSNHIGARGAVRNDQTTLALQSEES
ncbi:MAG: DUF1156 domain-containing protein [Nitrospiraceae bacterium]